MQSRGSPRHPLCFLVLHLGLVIQVITLDQSVTIITAPHEHYLHFQHAVQARGALLLLLPGRASFQALSGFHPRDMVGIVRLKFHELYVPVHVAGNVRRRRRTWMRLRSRWITSLSSPASRRSAGG